MKLLTLRSTQTPAASSAQVSPRALPVHAWIAEKICNLDQSFFRNPKRNFSHDRRFTTFWNFWKLEVSGMVESTSHEVTRLLLAWSEGDKVALDRLVPLVYAELRRLARHHMRNERAGHTLQTTALIHEAYLRLINADRVRLENRRHFFAAAARLMRQVLVDIARERGSRKRGGGARRVS